MSFGRKGLAAGQAAATHPGGGFGRAASAEPPARRQPVADADALSSEEIAARREAFIAAERQRAAGQLSSGEVSDVAASAGSDLASLANGARPARPTGAPIPAEKLGETGLPEGQEANIKAMARDMARGGRSKGSMASSTSSTGFTGKNPWAGKKSYVFGDPRKRSLILAYVLWYFAGLLGIHRAYCGYLESGIYQVALFVLSLVLLFIFPPFGIAAFCAWAGWLFLDLFLMPGMMRRFKAAHEPGVDTSVFE